MLSIRTGASVEDVMIHIGPAAPHENAHILKEACKRDQE